MVKQYIKDNNIQIIGISGKAGVGKDYVSEEIFVKKLGYKNFSLAWHFKIECVAKGLGDFEDVFVHKPKRVRRLLQVLGTEQGRDMWGEDIWVDAIFAWIVTFHKHWGIDKFVIPDVRFENELRSIQDVGGKVFRVIGNQNRELPDIAWDHPSETSLNDDDDFYDGKIKNFGESIQNLYIQAIDLTGDRDAEVG